MKMLSRPETAALPEREAARCCPVTYRRELLDVIPQEIIHGGEDFGDPSPFVKADDTVLDLGSGGGKLCFIASQRDGAKEESLASIAIKKCRVEPLSQLFIHWKSRFFIGIEPFQGHFYYGPRYQVERQFASSAELSIDWL